MGGEATVDAGRGQRLPDSRSGWQARLASRSISIKSQSYAWARACDMETALKMWFENLFTEQSNLQRLLSGDETQDGKGEDKRLLKTVCRDRQTFASSGGEQSAQICPSWISGWDKLGQAVRVPKRNEVPRGEAVHKPAAAKSETGRSSARGIRLYEIHKGRCGRIATMSRQCRNDW